MLIRQILDYESYTFTYLVADEESQKACLIDPVLEQADRYLQLIGELGLELCLALDTHVHADHITALGRMRELTGCESLVGKESNVSCASRHFADGDVLELGSLKINCLHTPGHTAESYCFVMDNNGQHCLFTGDTLLIRGTGRTDFQNGSAEALYHSVRRLLEFPDDSIVFPGHDYNGRNASTIGEEAASNPRIQISDINEFIEHMNNLNLPDPKMMDVAVSANLACGEIITEH